MNRYITPSSNTDGRRDHEELVHGFCYLRQQQDLDILSEDVAKFSELASFAAIPLVNAYFLAGMHEIESQNQGGFSPRDGVSGFRGLTRFVEKFNPILKQVLGFKLVDVPLHR